MSEEQHVHRPIYDIFEPEITDISTDMMQYIDYYDVNLNDANSVPDYRIDIKDRENFFLPAKSYLEISFKLQTAATPPVDFAANENVSLQNNAVGIINRYEFLMDDIICDYVDHAEICNTIQNLVYFSDNYSKTIATQQLWYPDTVSAAPTTLTNALGSADNLEAINYGHRKRWQLLKNSKSMVIHIPLRNVFGLFKSFDKVTKGTKLSLRLFRNDISKLILGTAAATLYINKNGIKWWIPKIKPNVSILPYLEAKLNSKSPHLIQFIDAQIYRSNLINAVANDNVYQIRAKRKRPVKVFVAFQLSTRVSGDHTNCKRIFDNVQLKNLRIVLNGTTQYPEREYITNFNPAASGQDNYARVYSELLRCGMHDHDIDQSSIITYDNFPTLFPIFAIDLSEKPEFFVEPESSLINVYWTTANHVADYYMWVVIESEKQLEMSSNEGQMKLLKVIN